jgi:hypothetical protein
LQADNFCLHDEQAVNGFWKIAWALVFGFPLVMAAYIYIYVYVCICTVYVYAYVYVYICIYVHVEEGAMIGTTAVVD